MKPTPADPVYTIAVDADGTLWRAEYPAIGKPRRIVLWCLRRIQARGHYLILNTCRNWTMREFETAFPPAAFLFWQVNENLVARVVQFGGDSRKISADYYLDDKACCFVTLRAVWLWLRLCIFSRGALK